MNVALIVENITGYLDFKVLLQVRLVNNLWNQSAKLHIKKYFISLHYNEKICQLMELFTDNFPLQKLEILDLILRNRTTRANVKNLIQKFGKSFKAYRFKGSDSNTASAELTEALMDILHNSPNLQILEFYENFTGGVVVPQIDEVICFLPKLNSFTIEFKDDYFRTPILEGTSFLKKILDASPSLQYLKIKNVNVELSSLIAVVASRNIKNVRLKQISVNSFQENSSFNGEFSLDLASVSVNAPYAHTTKLNDFFQKYSHTMKYLKIKGNRLQFVQIPTMKNLETLKLGEYDEQENSRLQFKQGQFPSLKRLRLTLNNSQTRLNFFIKSNLPLQNLNQLELIFCCGRLEVDDDELPASTELPLHLPLLKLLRVRSYSVTNITFPKTVSLHKLIMYNGFQFERIHLQFPNLKVLHIIIDDVYENGSKAEDLCKVFKTLSGIEELTLEFRIYSAGTLWKVLTGLARGDQDFMKEVIINMIKSNMTSLAQEILNESEPNLGNLIALKSLTVQGSDHMDASIAIAFLVLCGKLKNLRKLEISLLESSQRYFELIFGDILSSNNTRYRFLPGSESFYSKYLIHN